ncbi:DUF3226 domain-containing protein [Haliangium sp.]|uniref:DUF3226 domain-containing protein n=1 Tax=Haliangium sp. TaxID=2663208 RepID=UPI003D0BFB06
MPAILLVEGATDVDFFAALFRRLDMSRDIDILPPRAFGRTNTVTVIPGLLSELLSDFEDGQISGLGIVADADHTNGGGGFTAVGSSSPTN